MGLESAYWIALGVGAVFLVLSILLGDVLDVVELDIGDGVSATPVLSLTGSSLTALLGGYLQNRKTADTEPPAKPRASKADDKPK